MSGSIRNLGRLLSLCTLAIVPTTKQADANNVGTPGDDMNIVNIVGRVMSAGAEALMDLGEALHGDIGHDQEETRHEDIGHDQNETGVIATDSKYQRYLPTLVLRVASRRTAVAFSPKGTFFAIPTTVLDNKNFKAAIEFRDANTGEVQTRFPQEQLWGALFATTPKGHMGKILSLAFSPDGKYVASGSTDNTIILWDVETKNFVRELKGHTGIVLSVSFSPDGWRVVSGSMDNTVRIWSVATGSELQNITNHHGPVNSVSFSPCGTRVVSGSFDKTVRIWDVEEEEELNIMNAHTLSVKSVSFSPDGKRVVSGSNDRTVRIWDAETGEQQEELKGHRDWVRSVSFFRDGTRVVSGSEDKTVRIWDATDAKCLQVLKNHEGDVTSVSVSPDGERIVGISKWVMGIDGANTTIVMWDSRIIPLVESKLRVIPDIKKQVIEYL